MVNQGRAADAARERWGAAWSRASAVSTGCSAASDSVSSCDSRRTTGLDPVVKADLSATRNFPQTPGRNTASLWRCSTIRRCGRRCTASSPARRRGSRSPTTCRNTRNIRRSSSGSTSDRATPASGSLRSSIRQAVPRGRGGRAIPDRYRSHAVDAGRSFQCLIGEITAHEGFVNFVEIGDTIFHGNLRKIPRPEFVTSSKASALCRASHSRRPILAGAKMSAQTQRRRCWAKSASGGCALDYDPIQINRIIV